MTQTSTIRFLFIALSFILFTTEKGYSQLNGTISGNDVTCYGQCDGSASVNITTGTPPYTYLWNTSDSSMSISNLCSGTYSVTIIDNTFDSLFLSVSINEPTYLSISISSINATDTLCDGSATVNVTGGTPPYTYAWDDPGAQTTAIASNLCAGFYSVYVIDANGCSSIDSINILQDSVTPPSPLGANISSINASAFGNCDGAASANAYGGTGGYQYLWNTGQTTSSISNLCAGTYNVTVSDSTDTTFVSVTINEPADSTFIDSTLVAYTSSTNASQWSFCDGSASATASGGTPPYSYIWSTGETTTSITNLCSGTYYVTVTDAMGQSYSTPVYISEPTITIINVEDTIPVDTVIIDAIDTCIFDVTLPLDSAYIVTYSVNNGAIEMVWNFWQQGNNYTITASVPFIDFGLISFELTINCSGDFTRSLVSTKVTDAIQISSTGINDINEEYKFTAFPNPFRDHLNIDINLNENSNVQLSILNNVGQVVHIENLSLQNGINKINLDLDQLQGGLYFVRISTSNKNIQTLPIIKE